MEKQAFNVKKVLVASPRGFCAGVARAVRAVEDTLALFGLPVYVKHEIVHNRHVVERLQQLGARTIESVNEAPDGAVVVFSAHGSPPAHYEEAKRRHVTLVDATCPLVTKVHLEVKRFEREGYTIVYIGHRGHVEGIGVRAEGSVPIPIVETTEDVEKLDIGQPEKLVYLTQTTLSIDDTAKVIAALKKKYPQIVAPPIEDICYATTNRQGAVKELARQVDLVLIVGSQNSSNSKRLMETARGEGTVAYLLDDVSELDEAWLGGIETVGISAGASAPEEKVQELIRFFSERGATSEELVVQPETMKFSEPVELMKLKKERA